MVVVVLLLSIYHLYFKSGSWFASSFPVYHSCADIIMVANLDLCMLIQSGYQPTVISSCSITAGLATTLLT